MNQNFQKSLTRLNYGSNLPQEEQRLRERAMDLRRQSVSAFKLMADAKKDGDVDDDGNADEEGDEVDNDE